MAFVMGWQAARDGLALLLDGVPAGEVPQELKDNALELLRSMQPAYRDRNGEWQSIVNEARDRLQLEVPGEVETTLLADVPAQFRAADKFEEIVEGGFFGDYLEYTKESEAPTQFHFGSLLACVSACLGRRPLLGWQAAPTYPNIYMLLVGPTGTRKSTALGKARELIEAAFPKVKGVPSRVNVLPNEGSPQGYASALRNRNFECGTISDGIIVASELTVLVGKESYKQALGSWLVDWYDNLKPVWSRALKGEEVYELPLPYVCFAGASNMTWLKEIPEQLIKAGYMPRHLVFSAGEKRHDCANPKFDRVMHDRLVERLIATTVDIPEKLPLSIPAESLLDEWYLGKVTRQERGEVDELFAAWVSRKLPHALKVATVWQIVDGGPRDALHVDWLRRAIRLIDWMDAGVASVYYALGSTSEGAVTNDVMTYLERKGGELTIAAIGRGLRNRYNKKSVMNGIETLLLSRQISTRQDAAMGGTVVKVIDNKGSK